MNNICVEIVPTKKEIQNLHQQPFSIYNIFQKS
jgi:hypothetical protein